MSFHLKQTSPETYGNHACNHQINCERLQSLVKLGHAPVDVTKSFNISTSLLFMPNLRRQRWNTLEAERHGNQRRTEIPQVFLFQSVVDVPKACLNFLCWGEDSLFTAAKKREPSCDIDAVIKWCQFKQGCGFVCLKKSAHTCKSSNVAWNVGSFQALMTCIAWKATWSNMVKSGPTQPHSHTAHLSHSLRDVKAASLLRNPLQPPKLAGSAVPSGLLAVFAYP